MRADEWFALCVHRLYGPRTLAGCWPTRLLRPPFTEHYKDNTFMATFDQVRQKIRQLPDTVRRHAPNIVAETATEYFRNSFRDKGWDGTPWQAAKRDPGRGSLMVRSGALQASIRPSLVSPAQVRISGGSPTVPYAKIHNEGGTITQTPTAKQRRFLWAMERQSNAGGGELGAYGRSAIAKQLHIKIPKRQFMGHSPILNKKIIERLTLLIKSQ